MGREMVQQYFGNAMHVFLLDIPDIKFAALIPKGNFVTMCLLGKNVDRQLVQAFLAAPEVRRCFPSGWDLTKGFPCQCFPNISVQSAVKPFADRVVLVGDCASTKLYKDGIGAAYTTAKAAATTAIFQGIAAEDFKQNYWPTCRVIDVDNSIGKIIFAITQQIQKRQFAKRGVLRMVIKEGHKEGQRRHMSTVLWDTFTGSAPYQDIFRRTLTPSFLASSIWETIIGRVSHSGNSITEDDMGRKNVEGEMDQTGTPGPTQGKTGE